MTNVVPAATNLQPAFVIPPGYHYWVRDFGDVRFGLWEWPENRCGIYIFRYITTVPFHAPVVAGALLCIVIFLVVAGYYLVANLRHKDAPADAKLD